MADEVKNTERIDEFGQSDWNPPATYHSAMPFYPTGVLGRFFSRFFATKAQPYAASHGSEPQIPGAVEPHSLAGDTVVQSDTVKPGKGPVGFSRSVTEVVIPQLEVNRRNRYKDYDLMDQYPEVGTAFDIYADDSTQRDIDGKRWTVEHADEMVIEEVTNLFTDIKIDRVYWDIVRNTVKYGDCFVELVLDVNDPEAGIQRVKILNPNFILRVENDYGYLTDFLQEIPDKSDWSAFGAQAALYKGSKYITLDKNQIVHYRLFTSDPHYYPYGKSIAALAIRIFRSLRMMEEATIIYRIARAPERRIFYVDVGNLPTTKAEMFMERLKQKFKKEKYYNQSESGGLIDERYNPLSMDEDFFVPTRAGMGTKIETLPGAQNLGVIEDVRYFRDKLLAVLKVPKDYIVEKDKSPERKANLSQLDVKFARTITRVQQMIEIGLEKIAKRHLFLKGYPESMVQNLRIVLPDPSDMTTKRKLELNQMKAQVVGAVQGLMLFPKEYIYKEFYNLSDEKIEEYKKKMEEEQSDQMAQQQMGAMGGGPGMSPPETPPGVTTPPPPDAVGDEDGAQKGGESKENETPIKKEQTEPLNKVERVVKSLLSEDLHTDKLKVLNRLMTKGKKTDV